jgi:hypothetical protein
LQSIISKLKRAGLLHSDKPHPTFFIRPTNLKKKKEEEEEEEIEKPIQTTGWSFDPCVINYPTQNINILGLLGFLAPEIG